MYNAKFLASRFSKYSWHVLPLLFPLLRPYLLETTVCSTWISWLLVCVPVLQILRIIKHLFCITIFCKCVIIHLSAMSWTGIVRPIYKSKTYLYVLPWQQKKCTSIFHIWPFFLKIDFVVFLSCLISIVFGVICEIGLSLSVFVIFAIISKHYYKS